MDPPRTIYRKIVLKSSDSLLRHVQNRSVEVLRASRQANIWKVILEPDLEVILACVVYVGKGITVQLNLELLNLALCSCTIHVHLVWVLSGTQKYLPVI